MSLLVNFLLYQVGWFAVVVGAGAGRPWLGGSAALLLVFIHLGMTVDRPRHLLLAVIAGSFGLLLDTAQLWLGVFSFPSGSLVPWLVPPWIAVLWIQFATILPFCLRWLSGRYVLSGVVGIVGGPLAFFAGERLGAVVFLEPRAVHYLALAFAWCVALPTLVCLSDRIVAQGTRGGRYRWAAAAKSS